MPLMEDNLTRDDLDGAVAELATRMGAVYLTDVTPADVWELVESRATGRSITEQGVALAALAREVEAGEQAFDALADEWYAGEIGLAADLDQDERMRLAKIGQALDDGTYPVPDKAHLHSAAVLAASKHGRWQDAQRLIRKRAAELGVDVSTLPGFGPGSGKVAASGAISLGAGTGDRVDAYVRRYPPEEYRAREAEAARNQLILANSLNGTYDASRAALSRRSHASEVDRYLALAADNGMPADDSGRQDSTAYACPAGMFDGRNRLPVDSPKKVRESWDCLLRGGDGLPRGLSAEDLQLVRDRILYAARAFGMELHDPWAYAGGSTPAGTAPDAAMTAVDNEVIRLTAEADYLFAVPLAGTSPAGLPAGRRWHNDLRPALTEHSGMPSGGDADPYALSGSAEEIAARHPQFFKARKMPGAQARKGGRYARGSHGTALEHVSPTGGKGEVAADDPRGSVTREGGDASAEVARLMQQSPEFFAPEAPHGSNRTVRPKSLAARQAEQARARQRPGMPQITR